ncbi:hypothetical protein QE430_001236 [Microbacterium testaceum]|nr:hypothetical protein [Microbacterium testaceum]
MLVDRGGRHPELQGQVGGGCRFAERREQRRARATQQVGHGIGCGLPARRPHRSLAAGGVHDGGWQVVVDRGRDADREDGGDESEPVAAHRATADFGVPQPHVEVAAVVAGGIREAVEHGAHPGLGGDAATVRDVGAQHGAHARPVRGEAQVPRGGEGALQAGDDEVVPATEHRGHLPVHALEVGREVGAGDASERGQFVIERGQRRGGPRVHEVGGPLAVVDEREQHLEIEQRAHRRDPLEPRTLQGVALGLRESA